MSLVSFEKGTFQRMVHVARNMRDMDRREIFNLMRIDDPFFLAHWAAQADFKYVGTYDGEAVVAFGALEMWPKVWNIFMFATNDFPKVGLAAMRFMKQNLVPDVMAVGAHRAQCHSAEYHYEAHAFLRRMGAVQEGPVMKNYGKDGSGYLTFVWLDENKILNHRSLED